jgi:hypothetical protein
MKRYGILSKRDLGWTCPCCSHKADYDDLQGREREVAKSEIRKEIQQLVAESNCKNETLEP